MQKQRHYFANKGPSSQGYGFSSGHVWMWELDCEESWEPKNRCFWTVVLEKRVPWLQGDPTTHPKGDQSWLFIGRTDAEAEAPILWTRHGTMDSSKLGKEYVKTVYCHPAYLTYMQSTSCEMLGWMKHKLESRLLGEISTTSDMQMTPPLWQKVKRS